MNLPVESIEDISVITLPEDHLDASNHEELETAMRQVLLEHVKVVLNIREVEFIDSSGMGLLLLCIRMVQEKGGWLCICEPSESIRIAFELVRINRIVDIYDTQRAAIESYYHT